MKWQRARQIEGAVGFMFWVETGRPQVVQGVDEMDPHRKGTTRAYPTNLLGANGSQMFVGADDVELIGMFAVVVPIVDLRQELVTQGFTETGHRP